VPFRELKGQGLKDVLEGIVTFWEAMPSVESALSLIACEDAPSVDEFLALFDGPVNIDLESERVWPMPTLPDVRV